MACQMVTPISGTKLKNVSFKLSGWSVRYHGGSLLSCLANLGSLTSFTHYPQINTTLVTMSALKAGVDLVRVLSKIVPKVRAEVAQSGIQEKEKDLETPEVTAFISSHAFINEVDIYERLKTYGSLRALSFSYSPKYHKWNCKASFYENFSLDQLLLSNAANLRTLSDGSAITIEKLKKTCILGTQDRLDRASQPLLVPEAQETSSNSTQKQQISTKSTTASETADNKATSVSGRSRVSKSCSRKSVHRLPLASMFSKKSLYIENVLRILKCRNQEKSSKTPLVLRSKSTDSSPCKGSCIEISFPVRKGRTQPKSKGVQNLFFNEKELLFLEIGQIRGIKSHVLIKESFSNNHNQNPKTGNSYLSQSDLSDGYTAYEEQNCSWPAAASIKMTHRSQDSAKNSSMVLLTKYSSDAEHSLPENRGGYSDCPSGSNFDTLFGSHGQNNIVGDSHSLWIGKPISSEINIGFFTFPCS